MKVITNSIIINLGAEAFSNKRKRTNLNLHENLDENMQRMVNVLQPGTYLCPHKHENPLKNETFVILRGSVLVCTFDDGGNIEEHIILDREKENYIVEIPPAKFHTIIPLAVNTAVFECKDGPYNPDTDKIFAKWAPMEGTPESTKYNEEILKTLGLKFPQFF